MSIRFAPATGSVHDLSALILAPGHARLRRQRAANDNRASTSQAAFDPLLVDALRHFSRHGLNSAEAARQEAEAALRHGSDAGFDYWVGITRSFDPRLARTAEHAALQMAD
jgi:hypothetical protein